MAWVAVPGSAGIWEFNNDPLASDIYTDANGTTTAGVRSFYTPLGSVQETYVSVRKTGETIERGELSKNYYDALV